MDEALDVLKELVRYRNIGTSKLMKGLRERGRFTAALIGNRREGTYILHCCIVLINQYLIKICEICVCVYRCPFLPNLADKK